MHTQVAIIGAGPAGLLLSQLLHRAGVESVVVEARTRDHVERRIRAGVLEQGTVDLLAQAGADTRMRQEGLVHHGIELRADGAGFRVALTELTGRSIVVYGQTEVVKDLITSRQAAGGPIEFEAEDVAVTELTSKHPIVRYRKHGRAVELRCDFVAGCDGFHGVCRQAIPAGVLRCYERVYPYAWLGILAAVPPSTEELIYAAHERGFALHSLRSPEISRLYVQCDPTDDMADWPDRRIWDELHLRLARDGWELKEGPILEKGITAMRSFVAEPMRYGQLFLAGDAAHIVPPTGAKGLNLAASDVGVLAEALVRWYRDRDDTLLDEYSATCLARVWRAQDFSAWMTMLLHRHRDEFENRRQRSRLRYVWHSAAAARSLAENYVGLERV